MVKGSVLVTNYLVSRGVTHVFEYPGGSIAHVLDAIRHHPSITNITFRHEQGAAFAADAYGRVRNVPGVCVASSGPGATNLITGIANAYLDSIPMIAITGQVSVPELRGGHQTRQMGFQEVDIISICKPITKDAIQLLNVADITEVFDYAFKLAMEGRPGPVLIDIPMNVQIDELKTQGPQFNSSASNSRSVEPAVDQIDYYTDQIINALKASKNPLLFLGGGAQLHSSLIAKFVLKAGIPVVYSMMGKGVFDDTDQLCLGMVGWVGSRVANWAIQNADLIIGLGVRFDVRATGGIRNAFAPQAKIIHVDIDPLELNKRIKTDIAIHQDLGMLLPLLIDRIPSLSYDKWRQLLAGKCREWTYRHDYQNGYLHDIYDQINRYCEDAIIVTDVGQNQLWATQLYRSRNPRRFLTSGGLGAMGYGLPASIGAQFACPESSVIVITGDGSIQMNIQELAVIAQHKLPIKIIMFNNSCLGLVRQFQEHSLNKIYTSTVDGYCAPDFCKIIRAYGLEYYRMNEDDSVEASFQEFFNKPGAAVMEVVIERDFPVLPMLLGINTIDNQFPYK